MRWIKVALALGALGVVAKAASATPGLMRQTGLACNQCHMSVTLYPDFTWTGMKFRLNGFRTPWVAEKIEAGYEGAVNGNRLLLGIGSYLNWHFRSSILKQSKNPSDPALKEPTPNPVTTQLIGTAAMTYAGPIAENVGIWNEFYFYNGSEPQGIGQAGTRHSLIGISHFDVVLATNPGGSANILGFTMRLLPATGVHSFLASKTSTAPNGQLRNGNSVPYNTISVYGVVGDRVALEAGVEPGEDNLDFRAFNYRFDGGVFFANTDDFWNLLNIQALVGNDMVPNVGFTVSTPFSGAGTSRYTRVDAVRGVSATRPGGQPYAATDMGDGTRLLFVNSGGFTDKGPHSFIYGLGFATESETYSDGSGTKMQGAGFSFRYYYNRTYGVQFDVNDYLKYDFTDVNGIVHKIPDDPRFNVQLTYRFAQNVAVYFEFNNNPRTFVLDQNWRNGWSWQTTLHYAW